MAYAEKDSSPLVPIHLVREKAEAGKAPKLWIREPESQAEDRTLLAARLCSCSDVCLAVIEDR